MCASAEIEVDKVHVQRLYNVLRLPLVTNMTYYDQAIMAIVKDAGNGGRAEYSQTVLGPLHQVWKT